MNLHGPGYDAAERLGLVPALAPHDIGFFTSIMVHADGREKFRLPAAIAEAAVGTRARSIFRGDLESALYDAVAEHADIRFGTTVHAVTQNAHAVDATLGDGSHIRADLLIGADGVHSRIRELVFGPETEYLVDLGHMVGAYPLEAVPEHVPDGAGTTFIGPGRTAAVMNLGPQRSSTFFTYRCPDTRAELDRGPAAALTLSFGDLGGGITEALHQLETDPAGAYFDSVGQVVMDRWSDGRIVLLGDAAWCVTVFAGYGAALALDGADRLGSALDDHGADIPGALAAWESSLRPEVDKRQDLARKGISRFAPATRAQSGPVNSCCARSGYRVYAAWSSARSGARTTRPFVRITQRARGTGRPDRVFSALNTRRRGPSTAHGRSRLQTPFQLPYFPGALGFRQ